MTPVEYKKYVKIVVYLCSCSICNKTPEIDYLDEIDFDLLYEVSEKHMLTSMIGQILQSICISSPKFDKAVAKAQRKTIILNNDFRNIVSEFESSKIWYMPLKGAVLKDLYPGFAMREMADIDVLFDASRADDVKHIMENLEFHVKSFGMKNDDDYLKPPVSNFEMHRQLFYDNEYKVLNKYYENVKDILLIKDSDNSFGYHLKAEDFYVYMIAHEYKHFISGGTGLRSLLDTYVFLKSYNLDMSYVSSETCKIGIDDFERSNRYLAIKLFSNSELTEGERDMLDYILSSGTFGTFEHKVDNSVNHSGRKLNYITRRIIGPVRKDDPYGKQFRIRYATFFNHPILLPFLPIYRLYNSIKRNPKRLKREVEAVSKVSKKKI